MPFLAPAPMVLHAPDVVLTGSRVRVGGRVTGRRPRVVVVQRSGGGWRPRGRVRVARGGRFVLLWRAPAVAEVARLRVAVVLRSGRVVAWSRVVRVAVSSTRVLRAGRIVSAAGGVVRYAGAAPVRVGQFVAAGAGPETPFGLLGRVVSVASFARRGGGGRVSELRIEPARFTDAVPEGEIDLEPSAADAAGARRGTVVGPRRGSVAGARGGSGGPGRHSRSPRRAPGFRSAPPARGFRSALGCSGGVHAELSGSLAVRLRPRLRLRWSLAGVDEAEASATLRGDASLMARLDAAASCTLARTRVAGWDAPPLRFFAGPIPVVVVPRTTLYVEGEAQATAAVETGAHGYLSATAGLRYDGHVHPIGSFSHGFHATAPVTRLDGSVAARVIPSIEFLLYGQAGPRFDLSAGLRLDASAGADPWWRLTAPVELSAGLDFPGVAELTIPQRTVLSRTFPIAQAAPAAIAPAPGPPSSPAPATAPDSGPERARISWDTGSTDVDLHVWDQAGHHAWFRDPAGVPGGTLSEDDRYGFGPEYFHGGGSVTYGLCYFDDAGGGPTNVSVRLTDPDGAARSFTRTLAHEGDHVLLGSSPAGSGFVPPEGWCAP